MAAEPLHPVQKEGTDDTLIQLDRDACHIPVPGGFRLSLSQCHPLPWPL